MGVFDGFLGLFSGGGKTVNVAKRFDLQGKTGQGSMSKVYKAYDRTLGRTICLKLLDKVKTKKFEERFKGLKIKKPTEGQICVKLNHPNLVTTYEHGVTTEGEPYLVMEWVEGKGLSYYVDSKSKHLDGKRIHYITQLCDAITYLHGQKFLHRDLCPRNIMVTTEDVVKLIDFGLTVPYSPDFCGPGNRTGSPEYLAPEIIKRMATDHRIDLFALGITAFEMFTFDMPWERSVSSEETFRRRMNTPPRSARALNPKLDDEVVRVLNKSVAKERTDRYNSAEEMKAAFLGLDKQDY